MKLKDLIIKFLKEKGKATYRDVLTMAEEQGFIDTSTSSCLLTMHKKGEVYRSAATSNRYYSLDPDIASTTERAEFSRKSNSERNGVISVSRFDQLLRGVRG